LQRLLPIIPTPGVKKRIIAFDNDGKYMEMLNLEIMKKSGLYEVTRTVCPLTDPKGKAMEVY